MAAHWCLRLMLVLCSPFSVFHTVLATRTKEKIYIDLQAQESCFRLLNGTHQIGCSSSQEGNVGIVHYMGTEDDWNWVLKDGTTTPFAVILHSYNFTGHNVRRLAQSGRVNGIAVIDVDLDPPAGGFSADRSCPNDAYGMYHEDADYKDCKKQTWNPTGDGLFFEDHGMPIFSLTNNSDVLIIIHQCYEKFNKPVDGKARSHPLCAIQLKSFMTAAKDAETCIRRSNLVVNLNPMKVCDPVGDQNIITTLKAVPYNETRPPASVIVVAARMDTIGMFYGDFPSADSTTTGIVTLLETARVLWKLRNVIKDEQGSLDIMFVLFQGESLDYIGSSRMVYEMQGGNFPVSFDPPKDMSELDTLKLQKINLTHIAQFIEISQVDDILRELRSYGLKAGTNLTAADPDKPLPPASLQQFLKAVDKDKLFPSVVITDHEKEFTNKFYNSRFDRADNIHASYPNDSTVNWYDATTLQSNLTASLATTLAHYLFSVSMNREPSSAESAVLTANSTEVNHLYYCYLHSPLCELFNRTVDPQDADALKKNKKPYPFYVSIADKTNELTVLTRRVLSYFTGEEVVNSTEDECRAQVSEGTQITDERYTYTWMHGIESNGSRHPMCYKSTVRYSVAKSPAFDISDYDWRSGKYSTWSESIWNTFHLRVFLVPSKQFETTVLSVGVIITLVSMVILYFINDRADILFSRRSISRDYLFDRDL